MKSRLTEKWDTVTFKTRNVLMNSCEKLKKYIDKLVETDME